MTWCSEERYILLFQWYGGYTKIKYVHKSWAIKSSKEITSARETLNREIKRHYVLEALSLTQLCYPQRYTIQLWTGRSSWSMVRDNISLWWKLVFKGNRRLQG